MVVVSAALGALARAEALAVLSQGPRANAAANAVAAARANAAEGARGTAPILSMEVEAVINEALGYAGGYSAGHSPYAAQDLRQLNPGRWLDDTILDAHIQLSVRHSRLKAHAVSVHFYTALLVDGVEGVEAWTAGHGLSGRDLVLFPLNVNKNHWILVAANVPQHTLTCFDSMRGNNSMHMEHISRYLQAESGSSVPWTTLDPPHPPTQLGGHDCGVFVCASAAQLLRGEPPSLQQGQVNRYRRVMALDLHSGWLGAA